LSEHLSNSSNKKTHTELLTLTTFCTIVPGYDPTNVKLWPLRTLGSFYPANDIKMKGILNTCDKS
jgi:hypothetical protein